MAFVRADRIASTLAYRPERLTAIDDGFDWGVAGFLSALHGIAPETLPLARLGWREEYVERCGRFAQSVLPLLDADERTRAERLFAEAAGLTGFDPVPIHADLLPEHMRCRSGRLVGVIDWGDTCVGDPALDFAWLLHAHPRVEEVVAGYSRPLDDGYRERARFYYRLEPLVAAHYGLLTRLPAHVERGLHGIRARL